MGGASPNRRMSCGPRSWPRRGVAPRRPDRGLVLRPHLHHTRCFKIFTGLWEGAGPYTQTLLNAFETLPAGRMKDRVLTSVYALLRLSDALAERAGVDRSTVSSGTPNGDFPVPSAEELKRLSRRVRFSDGDLIRLNIDKNALSPFLLQAANAPAISDRPAGDTPIEFYPLQTIPSGIVVLNPANLSHRPSRAPCERGKRRWHGRSPSICLAP